MASGFKNFFGIFKTAGVNWSNDKAPRLGAALSYYTVFAIPPLFVIVLFIVSLIMDPTQVRSQMFTEVGGLIGEKSAKAIESAMTAQEQSSKGTVASIIAIVTLLITSTGLFIELQDALNTVWGVEPKPGQGLKGFIKNRFLSFAMVLGIGFLLLVSLIVSTALTFLGNYLSGLVPGMDVLWRVTNIAVSFVIIAALFAMIFKVLPDVKIPWRDVWVGAATTALLFTAGKFLLGWYLGRNSMVSAYGAAGSVILLLLWVYYSAQILFFGAELTQAYANRFGARFELKHHAQWVTTQKPSAGKPKPPTQAEATTALPQRKARLVSDLKREVASLRSLVEH